MVEQGGDKVGGDFNGWGGGLQELGSFVPSVLHIGLYATAFHCASKAQVGRQQTSGWDLCLLFALGKCIH